MANTMSTNTLAVSLFIGAMVVFISPRLVHKANSTSSSRQADLLTEGGDNEPLISESDVHTESLKLYYSLIACDDKYISGKIRSALTILEGALNTYGPQQLFSSYNGGKDAVVIMHLLRAAMAKYSEKKGIIYRPKFVYFVIDKEFPQVLEYIGASQRSLALDLTSYDGGIMKGLEQHVINMKANGLKKPSFVLGTRQGDPNSSGQEPFSPSSDWMPVSFMRVNPILDWDYGHIWHFLRSFELSYCSLYDHGYTSLGKVTDTNANPALLRNTGTGSEVFGSSERNNSSSSEYWPAYFLDDWSLERAGRTGEVTGTAIAARLLGESCMASKSIVVNMNHKALTSILIQETGVGNVGISVEIEPYAAHPLYKSVIHIRRHSSSSSSGSGSSSSSSSSSSNSIPGREPGRRGSHARMSAYARANALSVEAVLDSLIKVLPSNSVLRSCTH